MQKIGEISESVQCANETHALSPGREGWLSLRPRTSTFWGAKLSPPCPVGFSPVTSADVALNTPRVRLRFPGLVERQGPGLSKNQGGDVGGSLLLAQEECGLAGIPE